MFKAAFDETKVKVISAKISKVDSSGVLYVNEREGPIDKKVNIESDDVFELFREYRESKASPNFNRTTVYVKMFSTSMIFDFYVSLYYWKEGRNSITKLRFFNPQTRQFQKTNNSSILQNWQSNH